MRVDGALASRRHSPAMTHDLTLCDRDRAQLLVIDVQQRLMAAMPPTDRDAVTRNTATLLTAANTLAVPVLATEQYPRGLGNTEPAVAAHFPADATPLEKTCFSSCGADGMQTKLATPGERPQVVLAGVEAHVCVLQTAADLQRLGYTVFVAEDATCSRNPHHRRNALRRMARAGVIVSNTESIVFEWLRDARHAQFKALSTLFRGSAG